jgi:iron-sulfur cluster assembly protein
MFRLTQAAAVQVQRAAEQSGINNNVSLRLAARTKDNGSIEYLMGFDDLKDDDISFKSEGVKILIAPEYAVLLDEVIMDFVELNSGEFQFIFLNPKDPTYVAPKI